MLNVYDMDRRKTAVLQNAYDITETRELNKIYTLTFRIPATDEKVKYIQPFHHVRYGEDGELYRIIKSELSDSDTSVLNVECEHVIATLVDNIMFGAVQYGGGNIKTSDVITYLLDKQTTQNWQLAECDFDRRFEYLWEQENILNALYSIPREFTKAYKWVFNTKGSTWYLSLKSIDVNIHPEYYIRAKRNMLASGTAQDFAGICTRIYPLGYGEGVNQLSIKDATVDKNTVVHVVRNGKPIAINGNISTAKDAIKYNNTYIESPSTIVAQYGIKEKVLVDRRFEDANSLFSYAQTMLEGLQTPSMSRTFDVVDLYELTSQDIDNADVGKICKMTGDDTVAYITKTVRVLDKPGDLKIELSTKATDVASNIADLADRVRIESVYAQGATQLYQHSKDANATPEKGMVLNLYFPEEMRQINKVLLNVQLEKFRSYSKTTEDNGGFNKTYDIQGVTDKEITSQTNTENKTVTLSLTQKNTTHTWNDKFPTEDSLTSDIQTKQATISGTTGVKAISGATGVKAISGTTGVKAISGATGVKAISGTTGTRTISGSITAAGAVNTETTPDGDVAGTTSAASMENVSISGSPVSTPVWNWNEKHYTSTEAQINGSVYVDLGNENGNLTGETYANYYDLDGHHEHDHYYPHGTNQKIDGGYHHHKVYVNIPSGTIDVRNNLTEGNNQKYHSHSILLNSLSHSHDITLPKDFGSHSHTFKIASHTHSLTIPEHNHTWSDTSKTTVNGQIVSGHNHTWSDTSKTTVNGKETNGHNHTWSDTSTTTIKDAEGNDKIVSGHNHTWSDTSKTTINGKEVSGHNHTWSDTSTTTIKDDEGNDKIVNGHNHKFNVSHHHDINISHEHQYDISHEHSFECPPHKHKITIPGQKLTVTIPAHSHEISAGIFESGNASAFDIYVNGTKKTTINKNNYNDDISTWLLNTDNKIPRNTWIKVEIKPNDLAYIVSSVFVQGFVQSRGGQNY